MMVAMARLVVLSFALASLAACGSDGPSCELPEQWSTATSGDGSTCQVNVFTPTERTVHCGGSSGHWDCACGPLANPLQFESTDFCDLSAEERVCQGYARCGW